MKPKKYTRVLLIVQTILCSIAAFVILFALALAGTRVIYPIKYDDIVRHECGIYNIDIDLCRAVIWTESKYNKDATSPRGALGLMQVMPSTGAWIAKMDAIEMSDLLEPSFNIHIGVRYLVYLRDKFDDDDTVLAAYNAGEGNVQAWLRDSRYSRDNKTLVSTPFAETNNYIKRVQRARRVYRKLY